jgi:hypothetical protein
LTLAGRVCDFDIDAKAFAYVEMRMLAGVRKTRPRQTENRSSDCGSEYGVSYKEIQFPSFIRAGELYWL